MTDDKSYVADRLGAVGVSVEEISSCFADTLGSDDVLLLVGSVNDSYANSESDVDTLVIHEGQTVLQRLGTSLPLASSGEPLSKWTIVPSSDYVSMFTTLRNGRSLHAVHTSADYIRKLVSNLNERMETFRVRATAPAADTRRRGMSLGERQLRFLQEMVVGAEVTAGSLLRDLRRLLSSELLCEYLVHYHLFIAVHICQDLIGLFDDARDDDRETKSHLATLLVLTHIAVVLAAHQRPIQYVRFAMRELRRASIIVGDSFVNELVLRFELAKSGTRDDARTVIAAIEDDLLRLSRSNGPLADDVRYRRSGFRAGIKNPWPFSVRLGS